MAVEIPVIIDIEQAFDDAARRVDTASRPMRKAIEDATADMKINVAIGDSEKDLITLRALLAQVRDYVGDINRNFAFDKLQAGLENTKRSYNELNAIIQKRGTPATVPELESLNKMREAIVLMTQEVELRTRSARMVEEEAQRQIEVTRAIDKGNAALVAEARTMKELSDKISALRGKLENVAPDSDEWIETATEIKNATDELSRYQEKLKQVMSPAASSAPGSVDAIRQEMRKLQQQWDSMSKSSKFDASGNLTAEAQKIVDDYRKLTEEADKYGKSLSEAAGKATKSVKQTTTALRAQGSVLDGLANTAARYFSVYSVLRLAKQVRDVTGELEFQRVALGRLIQDEEYGAQLFEQIKEQAVKSPFRIQQLVTYTKQLAAYRIEQEELFDTTQRLADISAGLGVEMNRLILAYGQVRSASVLRGQELRQFTEAGIPLVQLLADKFTELNGKAVRTADVFELISKRAVPFSMISEIFEDMTDKGGMFYKMQEKQADTLKGRWEKLKDAFDIGLQSIGDTKTFEFYNKVIVESLTFLAKHLRVVPKLIEGISFAWGVYYIATTRARIATRKAAAEEIKEATAKEAQAIANIRGIKNSDAYTAALIRQRVATNALSRAFWKLWAAVVSNPIGAVLAALVGVASALFLFRKRTDEAASAYKDLDELIEQTSRGLKDTSKIDTLISRYESLASKTDLSVRESNRLYQTMTLLQEAFPNLQVGVEGTTDSIEEQVKKMRELNEERRKELLMRGEEKFQALQDEIVQKEKSRNKLYKEQNRLRSNLAQNVAEKGSEAQKKWTKELDNTNDQLSEMDKEIAGLQKRLQSLDRILHPEDVNKSLNAWQRFIKENSGINVNGISTSLFDDEQIEKWENLDAALEDIGKRKKKAQELEDSLSESIKTQTGEIREQIQAELDWARAERLRLQWLENWFSNPNVLQKDISDNFKILMQKTFDEGNLKQYGQNLLNYLYMQTGVKPDPQLLSRPLVDAAELVAKGWEEAGEGIATVYSSVYDWEDEGGKHNVMVTPILPDGSVLSPEELDEYVDSIISDSEHKDPKKLVLGFDVSKDAGERLHEMQEEFYHLVQMREELPEKFLFTDKDVAGIKEATDVIALADSKIASIEKELEAVRGVNIENLNESEIKKTTEYEQNLKEIHEWLVKLRDKFKVQLDFPDIAQDIIDNFDDILGRSFKSEGGVTIPVEFLISDKELQGLYNTGDLFDLLDKKISGIEKEIDKVNEQKIDPNVSEEVIEQSELYRLSLENVYQTLLRIQGRYRDQLSDIAKDVKDAFPDLMASAHRMEGKSGYATQGLFSDDELKKIRNVVDLYDVWSSKIQAVRKAKENFNKQFSTAIDEQTRKNARAAIDSLDEQEKKLVEFMTRYGFILKAGTKGGSGQDPWIILIKNRMKFMQDFQKGVEDMDKFMAHSASLGREQGIMKGRGLSLGIDTAQLRGDAEELRKWYSDAIDSVVKKIQSMGGKQFAGLGVTEILAKDLTGRKIQKYQELLQELWKGLTDFDTNKMKKSLEDSLARVKDEIKRSETARNFYQDILGLTGDEELATSMSISVYGGIGDDFKDRIKKQLVGALSSLDSDSFAGLDDKIREAFKAGDYEYLTKNIKKVPEAIRSTVQQVAADAEKFSADQIRTWIKELAQFKTYGEKRVQLAKQTAQKIEGINASDLPKAQKDSLILEYQRKEAEEAAKLQYEAFKDTPMYIHLFENLDAASTKMLTSMRDNLVRLKENWKGLDPTQLREMQKRIEEIDSQLAAKNPFKAIADGIRAYSEQTKGTSRKEIERNAILDQDVANAQKNSLAILTEQYEALEKSADATEEEKDAAKQAMEAQAVIADQAQETANASAQTAENLEDALKSIVQGAENIEKWAGAFSGLGSSVKNLMNEVLSDEDAEAFAEQFDGIMGVLDGLSKSGGGISKILKGDLTGIIDIVSGVVDSIASIFGASNAAKARKLNKAIEAQKQYIDELERSYNKLEKAMSKSFGTDYVENYTRAMENLVAQQKAYEEQARLEREKGKKSDAEKVKEYENAALDAAEKIDDARGQLQEFFSGTDLTSAAKDFSSAWLDAYKEFGSVTDAMKEKFQGMLDEMVENAMFAGLAQEVLGPFFDEIKKRADEGGLSAQDVADIASMVPDYVSQLNDTFTVAANQLQSYGYNLRQQVGSFTGISRSIAGASEESITGLAAGINTQNFYMQHIDMNVALILSALTGGASTAGASVTGEVVDPYKDQMLQFAGHIPAMDQNLAELLAEVRKVIKPRGTTATHYVATNL